MIVMVQGQRMDGTQWGMIKAMAELQPFETPWWLGFLAVTAALSGLLGVTGLMLLRQKNEPVA